MCPSCGSRFQVDGIIARCVGCAAANTAIYDANLQIIREEIRSAPDPSRALRHAYNDLVATFEAVCARRAKALKQSGGFQDPYEARRFFLQHGQVDILAGLVADELLLVRRVFHKRHAYQHTQGEIKERYVRKVPEDSSLLGTKAKLSLDEFEAGAAVVARIVDALVTQVQTTG